MAKITAPVADFQGTVAGVKFEDSQGETDSEAALAYFQRQGYTVEGADDFQTDDDASPYLENPAGAVGVIVANPKGPLDAADPDNDLVPVGGVKSAAAPDAPEPTKASRARRRANTTDQPADTTPVEPIAANGGVQHSSSATTATTPSAAPVGDDTAKDPDVATPAPDPLAGTTSSSDVQTSNQVVLSDGTAGNEAAKNPRPLPTEDPAEETSPTIAEDGTPKDDTTSSDAAPATDAKTKGK